MKAILGYCYCIDTKKKKKIVKTKKNLQNKKKTLVHFLNTKNKSICKICNKVSTFKTNINYKQLCIYLGKI